MRFLTLFLLGLLLCATHMVTPAFADNMDFYEYQSKASWTKLQPKSTDVTIVLHKTSEFTPDVNETYEVSCSIIPQYRGYKCGQNEVHELRSAGTAQTTAKAQYNFVRKSVEKLLEDSQKVAVNDIQKHSAIQRIDQTEGLVDTHQVHLKDGTIWHVHVPVDDTRECQFRVMNSSVLGVRCRSQVRPEAEDSNFKVDGLEVTKVAKNKFSISSQKAKELSALSSTKVVSISLNGIIEDAKATCEKGEEGYTEGDKTYCKKYSYVFWIFGKKEIASRDVSNSQVINLSSLRRHVYRGTTDRGVASNKGLFSFFSKN